MPSINRSGGWTFIELLAVLFIIGAIVTLGYPAYSDQLRKMRRAEAQRLLLESASAQERWFSRHFSYTNSLQELGFNQNASEYYRLSLNSPYCQEDHNISCYELSATARGVQQKDQACLRVSINHLGLRTPPECWE